VAPIARQIVADGTNLYYYVRGKPKGFSCPVSKLNEHWLTQLRRVPGTPMDHLLRLRGVSETRLEPTDKFPVRVGYQTRRVFAVLSLDNLGRLAQIDFFASTDMEQHLACHTYGEFTNVAEHVWIPRIHSMRYSCAGVKGHETTKIADLVVNAAIDERFFRPGSFFENVTLVPLPDEMPR